MDEKEKATTQLPPTGSVGGGPGQLQEKTKKKRPDAPAPPEPGVAPRLKLHYRERVIPGLMERLGLTNPFQAPRLVKIVVNMSVNEAKENIQALDQAKEELALITGQAPHIRRSKKSISNFKLREGMPIGLRVTLRGNRMYEFLDRLISIAIPRIRDFRGLEPKGFDGFGNYNFGLREQMIFPEINTEKTLKARGMNITFVISAVAHGGKDKDSAGRALLEAMGMPFKKRAVSAEPAKAPQGAA